LDKTIFAIDYNKDIGTSNLTVGISAVYTQSTNTWVITGSTTRTWQVEEFVIQGTSIDVTFTGESNFPHDLFLKELLIYYKYRCGNVLY
jgi:hypothetical protein